jgi:branched-chain amino acid transport system substrate-binding protein
MTGEIFRNVRGVAAIFWLMTMMAIGGAQAGETIKIGTFLSVSGPASFLGDPELKTLQMYVEKINADGGVLGKKLELVHYDVQHVAKKAVTAVKRLIDQDQVDVIVGGSTSGQTMAVIRLIEKAGIPFISLAGAAVITDPVKKWVFKTPHTDILAAKKIFSDMKANGWSKLGLLSGAGGFDKSCRKSVKKVAKTSGITIVADETHGKGDTDMTPQLTKIKGSPGIQAFMYCGFGAATSIVAKNFKQLGLSFQHYQSHGAGSMSFIKNAAGAANGARLPAAALLVVDALSDDDPQKPVAGAYKAAYEAKHGPVSTFGGHAYDGLMIVVQALKRAGSTDKEKVRSEIENTKNFIGADGIFTMSATDHLGLDEKSFVMVEVKGGVWKKLSK